METKAIENSKQENKYGYIDPGFKIYEQPTNLVKDSNLPSKFDLRDEEGVTSVKNQNPYGTCWAFATMASVESNLKYTTGKDVDLSEINMAIDRDGIDGLDKGGNFFMSTSYFANGSGPVLEKDDPYPSYGEQPVDKDIPPIYNINNCLLIPARKDSLDNSKIKEAIMDNGAVGINYNHNDYYLGVDKVSYYSNEGKVSNHAVAVIGWDDNYPKEKFKNTPSGDGAFIVKNSWGNNFGESGYLYISYYDTSLGSSLIVTTKDIEDVNSVDNKYTYGKYCQNMNVKLFNNPFITNVHQVKSDELLNEVSLYTLSTNVPYEIYIDEDYKESNYPNGDISYILNKKRKSGTLEYAGFNTIKFDNSIEVETGRRFMVAVKYTGQILSPDLDFIDNVGKENSFYISNNKLVKKDEPNPLTIYSYNKSEETARDINIDKTLISPRIGEKLKINSDVVGDVYTSKKLKWTSSNHKVAVVDEDGVVTGRGNGNSIITVSNRSGSIKKAVNVSINTNLSILNSFNSINKDERCITFDEAIEPSLDYSKIELKDKDGNIIPISIRVDNKKLYFKVNKKYFGYATLSMPQNAVKNKVNKGLSSDKNFDIVVNSYDETDHVTLGSKDIMKAIAEQLNKSESEITSGDISNISYINLYGEDMDFKDIGMLSSLISINAHSNGNSKNLAELKLLKNLQDATFGNVNMVNLECLKNSTNLEYINIYNCNMFSLGGIESFEKLQTLGLINDQITDISPIANCTQITELNLNNNKITNLNGVENLKKLKTIYCEHNYIKDLRQLENCTSIDTINLEDNEIEDLTPIKTLSELKTDKAYLTISNNHINSDNPISKYLNETKGWSITNKEQKGSIYELNGFRISENEMNNKNPLTLTFNREVNKEWQMEFYRYDKDNKIINLSYDVMGNKVLIDNNYDENGEKSNYNLYCNISYVDDNGVNQKISTSIYMNKTGFYTEDINKDKNVDIEDLAEVASHYNERALEEKVNWQYDKDINLDGIVDIYDLVDISRAM
jgi:C1A family cysteine protease